jgi:hypothetical protein
VFVQRSEELVNLIEEGYGWSQGRDLEQGHKVVGRKNHILTELLAALKRKRSIKLAR